MRLYLAHPFDARQKIREWELEFEARTGIELVNPFYDAPGRSDVEMIDAGRAKRYEKLNPHTLVRKDLLQIEQSDGIVAIIDGSVSYGTIMEIMYAYRVLMKRVYLVVMNGHENHPWLVYHSDRIFTSMNDFEIWSLSHE